MCGISVSHIDRLLEDFGLMTIPDLFCGRSGTLLSSFLASSTIASLQGAIEFISFMNAAKARIRLRWCSRMAGPAPLWKR
jgi:hypothetical protein